MGKLFDSMKQRGTSLPSATSAAAAPRLQVLPALAELPPVDDHEPMPFYEVPNEHDPVRRSLSFPTIASTASPLPAKQHAADSVNREQIATQSLFPASTLPSKLSFAPAVPREHQLLKHFADELVVVHQPSSNASLEYRALAEQLIQELTSLQAQSMTLLPLQHQSASTLAANLGCAWAEITRHPLVLIDAARSNPGDDLACLFGLTNAPGWEELMTGSSLGESLQQTGRAWLDLIGSGRRLAWSNTQSWAEKSNHVVQSLGKHYRHVLLLGPAFPHSPLGLVLAETTATTCIVVAKDDSQQTHRDIVLHSLAQQGKPVIGTILLDV